MWYHVSKDKWAKNYIEQLRIPDETRSFGELKEPRLSVAPTVCHALLGVPEYHENEPSLLIYEVNVQDPVLAAVMDAKLTQEHLITQDVLDRHDGIIAIRLLGQTIWTKDMRLSILHAIHMGAMTFDSAIEKEKLWDIVGDEWRPRFDTPGSIEDALSR